MHHEDDLLWQAATAPIGRFLLLRRSFFAYDRTEPAHPAVDRGLANELDFQDLLDGGLSSQRADAQDAARSSVDRLAQELDAMAPLPDRMPTTARRWTTRVPPDPHLRVHTNDYSLDPARVGRRAEVIIDQRTVTALALDTGDVACRHARTFTRHRTITALEHARALKRGREISAETPDEVRPLDHCDALIS